MSKKKEEKKELVFLCSAGALLDEFSPSLFFVLRYVHKCKTLLRFFL